MRTCRVCQANPVASDGKCLACLKDAAGPQLQQRPGNRRPRRPAAFAPRRPAGCAGVSGKPGSGS
jgi:hypothetical protein